MFTQLEFILLICVAARAAVDVALALRERKTRSFYHEPTTWLTASDLDRGQS